MHNLLKYSIGFILLVAIYKAITNKDTVSEAPESGEVGEAVEVPHLPNLRRVRELLHLLLTFLPPQGAGGIARIPNVFKPSKM